MKKALMLIKRGVVALVLMIFPKFQTFVIFVSVGGLGWMLSLLNDRYMVAPAKEVIHRAIFSLVLAPFLIVILPSKEGEIYPKHWGRFRRIWVTLLMASALFFVDWKYEPMFFRW